MRTALLIVMLTASSMWGCAHAPVSGASVEAGTAAEGEAGWVARVDGVEIPVADYRRILDRVVMFGQLDPSLPAERIAAVRQEILDGLIDRVLVHAAARKAGVVLDPQEMAAAWEAYKGLHGSEEEFQRFLAHGQLREEDIQALVRDRIVSDKLVAQKGSLVPDEADLQRFYDENAHTFVEQEVVGARHILVLLSPQAPPADEARAQEKVAVIQQALAAGVDFAEVAQRFSEGPTRIKGGDLGLFARGMMVQPFEEVAFTMQNGQVSAPVRTHLGVHIIQVYERRPGRVVPFNEVRTQLLDHLTRERFTQARQTMLATLRQAAEIETQSVADIRPSVPNEPSSSD